MNNTTVASESEISEKGEPAVFQCSQCGQCCSSWNILIEAEKAQALLTKPWVQVRLQLFNAEIRPVTKGFYRLPLTPERVCVFLAEDARCLIEATEGRALKPLECQKFPFAAVFSPNGERKYDTTAACKAVTENLLKAFSPIVPDPEVPWPEGTGYGDEEGFQQLPGWIPIGLPFSRKISYKAYQLLIERFQETWKDPSHSTEAAFQFTRTEILKLSPPISTVFFRAYQPSCLRRYWQLLWLFRKPYGTYSKWQQLVRKKLVEPAIFGVDIEIPIQNVRMVNWNCQSLDPILKSFLFQVLQRQKLLSYGHSLWSILALVRAAAELVIFHSQALAWLEITSETSTISVQKKHVLNAIQLVERYYTGHQPNFIDQFRTNPVSRFFMS